MIALTAFHSGPVTTFRLFLEFALGGSGSYQQKKKSSYVDGFIGRVLRVSVYSLQRVRCINRPYASLGGFSGIVDVYTRGRSFHSSTIRDFPLVFLGDRRMGSTGQISRRLYVHCAFSFPRVGPAMCAVVIAASASSLGKCGEPIAAHVPPAGPQAVRGSGLCALKVCNAPW